MFAKLSLYSTIIATVLFFELFATPTPSVLAAAFDAYPLRPVDTSSPRDTLRAFLKHMNDAYFAWQQQDHEAALYARIRALETLDLSETTNANSWGVQTKRIIYLKEILDRIPLPSLEMVPGDDEVADGRVSKWTIPDTRISIVKVDRGERAGEYLFSAITVARLHLYYRQSDHLPYKPGASVGFLEDYLAHGQSMLRVISELRSHLDPIDTSNPQTLMQEFLASVNGAYVLIMKADAAFRTNPPTMTREKAVEIQRQAATLIERAVSTLDQRRVPDALRRHVSVETVLMLKEIFDRSPLPAVSSIPGMRIIQKRREVGGSKAPIRWFFPNTQIEIAELPEGPMAGRFRFTARTVVHVAEAYQKVRHLPYRAENMVTEGYDAPEVSAGLYEYYRSTPGYLVPGASWLGAWVTTLPDWLNALYFGQRLWKWIGIVLVVLIAALACALVYAAGRFASNRVAAPLAAWIKLLMPVANACIVLQVIDFINTDLNVPGRVSASLVFAGTGIVYLLAAVVAMRLCIAVAETLIASPRIADESFDATMLRVGARALGFVVAVVIVVKGVEQLGADVVPLLAGLGVGGLAVALAVRPTLENMIGGIILYADRPIRVGDFCTFGEQTGTVERIGLRSTRVRGLDRTLITVPNAAFADMQLINWAQCDKMLITTVIGLRYETTPDQLRHVLARMRELCFAHPKIDTETLRVRLSGFGASALDVTVRVYALTNNWDEYHAIREDLYLRFAEIIAASGTSVAFPSRTLYMGHDAGLDPERIEAAEDEVAAWRHAGTLPFPRTPEARAAQLTDSLDYPPHGSSEANGEVLITQAMEPLSGDYESVSENPKEDRV